MKLVIPDFSLLIPNSGITKAVDCRHVAAEYNKEDVVDYCMRRIDPPISEDGRKMAETNRDRFLTLVGDGLFTAVSSTMERAENTMEVLCDGGVVHKDERLVSADFHDIEPTIEQWAAGAIETIEAHRRWIRSESFIATVNRVAEALEYLLSEHPESSVLAIMAHEEICSIILALLSGVVPQRFMEPGFRVEKGKFMLLLRKPDDLFFTLHRPTMPEAA